MGRSQKLPRTIKLKPTYDFKSHLVKVPRNLELSVDSINNIAEFLFDLRESKGDSRPTLSEEVNIPHYSIRSMELNLRDRQVGKESLDTMQTIADHYGYEIEIVIRKPRKK